MTSGSSREFTLSAALMVTGAVFNAASLALLPSNDGEDHEAIFAHYADSGTWVAGHLVQFTGVILGLAGLLVLARALRSAAPHFGGLAAAGAVMTAAVWALVQAVDGVALKHAIDAWVDASPADEASRFANAETVVWTGWGIQSIFYGIYGLTLVLLGAAIGASPRFATWIGGVALGAGLLSLTIGIDVGSRGSETEFYDVAVVAYQLLVLVFVVGILVSDLRFPGAPLRTRDTARGPTGATGRLGRQGLRR